MNSRNEEIDGAPSPRAAASAQERVEKLKSLRSSLGHSRLPTKSRDELDELLKSARRVSPRHADGGEANWTVEADARQAPVEEPDPKSAATPVPTEATGMGPVTPPSVDVPFGPAIVAPPNLSHEDGTEMMLPPLGRSKRAGRLKTRLLGFDQECGDSVDLFASARTAPQPSGQVRFPVGWIIVAEGPGRGECFTLMNGVSQIGRGEDQAVRLSFGDTSVSRENHAAIAFDPDSNGFTLAQGGKANLVRLNGRPVLSNEPLRSADQIRIGKTVLRFVALCGDDFSWDEMAGGSADENSGE